MFNSGKKKIILTHSELRLLTVSLNLFRSNLIKEQKYTDAVDDILIGLKNKMKVTEGNLGIMMLAIENYNSSLSESENSTEEIEELKLKIIDVYKSIKK